MLSHMCLFVNHSVFDQVYLRWWLSCLPWWLEDRPFWLNMRVSLATFWRWRNRSWLKSHQKTTNSHIPMAGTTDIVLFSCECLVTFVYSDVMIHFCCFSAICSTTSATRGLSICVSLMMWVSATWACKFYGSMAPLTYWDVRLSCRSLSAPVHSASWMRWKRDFRQLTAHEHRLRCPTPWTVSFPARWLHKWYVHLPYLNTYF